VLCEVAAGNLQGEVSPEKDAGYGAGLLRVEMKIAADPR
jgi:hypothetical protein